MKTTLSMEKHWTMPINVLSAKTGSSLSYIDKTLDMSSLIIVEILAALRQVRFSWHWQIKSQHKQVMCYFYAM